MTDRLLLVSLLLTAILVCGYAVRLLVRRGHDRAMREARIEPTTASASRLILFTGSHCDACERQKAIVGEFLATWPKPVELSVIDAATDPETAWKFRVMTVPTTVVARPDGTIAAITTGVFGAERLATQLAS